MTPLVRRVVLAVLAVAGTLALVYAADVALAAGGLPRGVRIGGVHVGGKSRSAATRALQRAVVERARQPITLRAEATTLTLDPARAGLGVDIPATLDQAGAGALNPWRRLTSLFGTTDSPLVAAIDQATLRAEVRRVTAAVDWPAREGAVHFTGTTPVAVLPQAGRAVDVEATAVAVMRAYLQTDDAVALTMSDVPVKSTPEGVNRALTEIAQPAVAAPILLESGAVRVTMSRAATAAALTIAADASGALVPRFDPKRLDAVLHPALGPLEFTPHDADFEVVDGAVRVTPSTTGKRVDLDALARDLLPVLTQPAPRVVTLAVVEADPTLSTTRAQQLGIRQVVGEFTTRHPCCRPRVNNIHRMADIVDGALVLPGETFSLNGYVGERDRGRGFVEAPMILEGRFVNAVGGGVSQFATTMFNAVFFSGMQDVSHKPHSYYISRYPAGREATVSSPAPDLKWRNDSPYGVLVKTSYTGTSVTVTFWSTKRYDIESVSGPRTRIKGYQTRYDSRPTCEKTAGEPGFDITVWRVFKQNGKEVKRERFVTRYQPEPHFVCGKAPAPKPSPSASPSPSPSPSG